MTIPAETEKWDNSLMKVNVPRETIQNNIRTNIKRPIPQLRPYPPNDTHIAVVAGGWSLHNTFDKLRELYFNGTKIVALNGSAHWLLERNIRPSMHILMDARPDNVAFVQDDIPHCKYFLASQCDPIMFEATNGRDVTIYHVTTEDTGEEAEILNKHYLGRWARIHSASTVGIVSIMLLRTLGFQFQHLFGYDSCVPEDGSYHHAYPQTLNDTDVAGRFHVAGKDFMCTGWQAAQAESFKNLVKHFGHLVNLSIHGEGGLLRHILEVGAEKVRIRAEDDRA